MRIRFRLKLDTQYLGHCFILLWLAYSFTLVASDMVADRHGSLSWEHLTCV
jgi:hypothetical protein